MLNPIGDFLDRAVKRQGIAKQVEASQVMKEFEAIVVRQFGRKILNQVQAKSLKNQVLSVAVLSSVVANELRINEKEILNKINDKYKKTLVEKLRFLI